MCHHKQKISTTTVLSKRCPLCEETKPYTEFYKAKRGKYGVGSYCKECTKFMRWKEHRDVVDGKDYTREDYLKMRKAKERDKKQQEQGVKKCRDCGKVKSLSDFYVLKYRSGKRKPDSYCMECKRSRNNAIKKRKRKAKTPAKLTRPEKMDDSINKLLHSKW